MKSVVMAATVLAVQWGCTPRAAGPCLSDVRIVDRDDTNRLDLPALEKLAIAPLAKTLPLRRGAVGDETYRLTVSIRTTLEERDGKNVLASEVSARLLPAVESPKRPPFVDQAVAEHELAPGQKADDALVRAHVARAVADLMRGLGARVQLAHADESTILYALDGPDSDLQAEAFVLVSERRDREAVPTLISLLKRPEPAIVSRSIGALAEIGDPRAVKPLIARVHFDDLMELVPLVDALAAIGGDEAAAYLELVASGHDFPKVRALAAHALEHLHARAAARRQNGSH